MRVDRGNFEYHLRRACLLAKNTFLFKVIIRETESFTTEEDTTA